MRRQFQFDFGEEHPEVKEPSAHLHSEPTACLAETPFQVRAAVKDGGGLGGSRLLVIRHGPRSALSKRAVLTASFNKSPSRRIEDLEPKWKGT